MGTRFTHPSGRTVVTDEDFEVDSNLVTKVILVGDEGGPALQITLNANPQVGDDIRVVACDVPAHVIDAEGNLVADIPVGQGTDFSFCPTTDDANNCDCSQGGHWLPICCPGGGATGATGATGPTGGTGATGGIG
jgi:hypothetical protein